MDVHSVFGLLEQQTMRGGAWWILDSAFWCD